MKSAAICTTLFWLTVASVSSAFGQERQWLLDAADQDVFLIFGVAETNDVGVSFWCKIGTQKISAFTTVPPGSAASGSTTPVELSANGAAFLLAGAVSPGDQQATLEAPLSPQDKIIETLKESERFNLRIGDHIATYPLAGADFDGLIRLCTQNSAEQP